MQTPPIRTITLGIAEPHPLSHETVQRAASILRQAQTRCTEAGYEVQTIRLSTRSLFDDLPDSSPIELQDYAQELQRVLDDVGLNFCSLGTANVTRPDFLLERINLIPDLLSNYSALNATVQLASLEYGLRADAALPTARIMKRLAQETEEGFGNFRFAMLACVAPGCPFFPSAYHAGPTSLSLGVQGANILISALQSPQNESPINLIQITEAITTALIEQATPIVALVQSFAREHNLAFGGIDLSPAPMGENSIAAAIEQCGYGFIGTAGTVAVAAAITAALKNTQLPACGYSGLMLPVLEDAVLGRRWEEGLLSAHQLLLYSAICGTGLDTLPLPGDIPSESISHLLLDVATLALRLNKQLSARLFPVPAKRTGDHTEFTSPYLTNTIVK